MTETRLHSPRAAWARPLLCVVALMCAGACWLALPLASTAAAQAAPSASAPPAAPARQATLTAQTTGPQAALDAADAILKQMSAITGLPVKEPLQKRLISKPEMKKYLEDNLRLEMPPSEMHGQDASLKAFGIVGPEFDLEKFLISFYTEQAAGFYDPRRKTMFMADWVAPNLQSTVLAHELTHALQDQSFDLWKFMHATRDDDDATAAREALVEGYATLAMTQASLGSVPVEKIPSLDSLMDQLVNQQMAEFPVFTKAPFFLRFQALFPYVQGMHFARRALELGGWTRLNQTFGSPPRTTAQIFRPDLYFDSQAGPGPEPVTLPAPPVLEGSNSLKKVEANVMGDIGYFALIGQLDSQQEAQKLVASWRGDRYLVYEGPDPGEYALVARTRWSSAADASAFCGDYRRILQKRWPGPAGDQPPAGGAGPPSAGPQILLQTAGPRRAFLLLQGDECRWAEGVPAAQTQALQRWLASLP